jgi:transposase
MERRNPFYRRSRISAKQFRQLVRYFAMNFTATDAAQLTGLTRMTVTTIFLRIRARIAEEGERQSPFRSGDAAEYSSDHHFCQR